ncbi:hypothetical protein ACR79M_15025 [Sphingobacterium spiritivorum]|uniref:hypothetical protein n=1 Tax=Sphingobacterium spiritivorum TaxID=258 RepID=UPI003DA4E621
MKLDIDKLVAEFGDHYVDGGQGLQDLQAVIMERTDFLKTYPPLPTDDTVVYKTTIDIGRVLQKFQKGFTLLNGNKVDFKPQPIFLYNFKMDELIYPDEIKKSYAGFLASDNLERTEWPIVRYVTDVLMWKKFYMELEQDEVFKGVEGVLVEGVALGAGNVMNGVRKLIRDGHAAGQTNMITLGAVPTTDPVAFVTYVENFVKPIPKHIRKRIKHVEMSSELEELFRIGNDQKYNTNYERQPNTSTIRYNSNITVVGSDAMEGSTMIFATIHENKANPIKGMKNQGRFDVQKDKRGVALMCDFWIGVGFWYLPYVYHNDQDLV